MARRRNFVSYPCQSQIGGLPIGVQIPAAILGGGRIGIRSRGPSRGIGKSSSNRVVSKSPLLRGTEGSNPSPSSGESIANLTSGPGPFRREVKVRNRRDLGTIDRRAQCIRPLRQCSSPATKVTTNIRRARQPRRRRLRSRLGTRSECRRRLIPVRAVAAKRMRPTRRAGQTSEPANCSRGAMPPPIFAVDESLAK